MEQASVSVSTSKYGKRIPQNIIEILTVYGDCVNTVECLYLHRTEDYLDFHKFSPRFVPLIKKDALLNCHTKVDLTVVRVIY